MKKLIALAVVLLMTVQGFAQDGKSIYNKYSGEEGVSAVYISKAMFKMMGKLPSVEINDSDVNLSKVVSSLDAFYLIESGNKSINDKLAQDVRKFIDSGDYEILMEVKDDGETVRFYTIGDEQIVTGLVMMILDGNECTFLCLDGRMQREDLEKIISEGVGQD